MDFQPVEILFIRFMMGFLALLAVCPRRLQGVTRRQEGLFALAGLCGVCLYYLLENIALTYTMASNVGVIISVSPCFTALLTHFLMRGEAVCGPHFRRLCGGHGGDLPYQLQRLCPGLDLRGICWRCWPPSCGPVTPSCPGRSAPWAIPLSLTTRRTFSTGWHSCCRR